MTQHQAFDFSATDLCVKCGLCLPHCPTYQTTQDENESPRGRLALIDGWSRGQLEATAALTGHLDRCLLCRSCESVCPADVPYADIVDAFRQQARTLDPSLPERILLNPRRKLIHRLLRLYQLSGIQALVRLSRLNRILGIEQPDKLIPDALGRTFEKRPSDNPAGLPAVSLFTGCASEIFDPTTLTDSVQLLEHCGYQVHVPAQQPCCGALDQHAGRLDAAQRQQESVLDTFKSDVEQPIVSVASGCGAMLQEHPDSGISQHTLDISSLLAGHRDQLRFRPLKASVLLHTPCTLKKVMQQASAPVQLLKLIPQLEVSSSPSGSGCCGAAGTYMLNQPKMADDLRQQILAPLTEHSPDYLLTSNIGCALHLRAGLREAGLATQVLHPVSLLAQQLIR